MVGMSPARRRGFEVLVAQQSRGRLARESNSTDAAAGFVYWQSCRWLIDAGLAYFPSGSSRSLALTDRGREVAAEMGLAASASEDTR